MRFLGSATNFVERLIDDPNTAAAATCFASRVYSDQTKYSIKGGCRLFAISWSQRSVAPSRTATSAPNVRSPPDALFLSAISWPSEKRQAVPKIERPRPSNRHKHTPGRSRLE
jgi:hypothetical protein